ncbi:MAG: dienelactone hydrolase family protein, partial [Dehalococcoidia bacterium]
DGLASNGYLAIAPDLLSHEGGTAQAGDVPSVLRGVSMARHVSDVDAVVRYLRAQPGVGDIGIIGFCFGGGVVWNVVTSNSDIAAAVPFYGSNPPLDQVSAITAAVRGIYGELDSRINAGIPAITEALTNAGVDHELEVYPDAPHAFLNHTNAGRYVEAAATEAWPDALSWLQAHLGA